MKHLVVICFAFGTFTGSACAGTITYTQTATASGTIGGKAFTNALVTVTLKSDTANIAAGPSTLSGFLVNVGTATINIAGLGTGTITDLVEIVSSYMAATPPVFGQPSVLIATLDDPQGLSITGVLYTSNAAFLGYDLGAPLGPISGSGGAASGANAVHHTSLGDLVFTSDTVPNATFTATVPVPATGSTSNVTVNLTATAQTHTVPFLDTFAETGSVSPLGNATLYMAANVTITNQAVVVPPIILNGSLSFSQTDSIGFSFEESDSNFDTAPTFTLTGAAITGGTGVYAGATGSLNLTFTHTASLPKVYTTAGSGSLTLGGKTTALTLAKFAGSGGPCTACSLEYNNISYAGTVGPLGNVTLFGTTDVTQASRVFFGTVGVNSVDTFNLFSPAPADNIGIAFTTTVAGGTGAYAGATGSFSVTLGQNSAGALTVQGTGTLTTAAPGTPIITQVKTAFGMQVVAANTWVQINGKNLAPANTASTGVDWSNAPEFASGKMPTKLGPISVTFNAKPGYIFFYCSAATDPSCSSDQINVLAPLDSSSAQYPVEVVVTNNGVASAPFTVLEQPVSPTFPLFDVQGHVVARHLDFSLMGPANLFPGSTLPAKAGETLILVAYGLGAPTGAGPVEGSATQAGSLPASPQCWISGVQANVAAALISPGLYQMNVTVPLNTASGDNPITCSYQGYPTAPGALIAVQ